MITLKRSMSKYSRDIYRDGIHLGYLQWNSDREPRITLVDSFSHLTINEIKDILEEYERIRK